ncbi:hypothetical protein CBR_g31783 [Chara braunii]|uniref:Uncharacterized protein n=1 Tax=Chara braunii TaxID=69332 RepID=A0A388LFR9_CHABU|nr:hypothetical protein CBR_g31783 [Chara braunii]|eukprot:GBG81107.1 hypothetical protein CBR_g31783 [Chara braunii]
MSQDRGKDPVDSLMTARQGHNTKTFDSPFKVDPKIDGKRDDPVWHFIARGRYLDGSTTAGRKSGRRCLCRLCRCSICGGAKAAKKHFSKSEKFRCEAATPAVWNAIWLKDMTKCPKKFASAIETLQSLLLGHPSLEWPPLRFPEDAMSPLVPPTAPSGAVASPNSGAPAIRDTVPRPATTVATRPAAPPSAPLVGTRGARDVGVGRSTPANEPPPVGDGVGSAAFDEASTRAFIESRRWGGSAGSSAPVLAPVFRSARQSDAARGGTAVAPSASPRSSSEHLWLPPPPSRAAQRPVVHHTHGTAHLDPSHAPADARQSASVPRFGEQVDHGVPAEEVPAPVYDSSPTPIPTTTAGGRSAPQPPPVLTGSLDPLQRIRDLAVAQSATPTVWSTSKIRKDTAEVTACIGSPPWWEDLRALCKMLEPIMDMLRLVDSDIRQISKILRRYEEMIASCLSACRDIDREQQDAIVEVFLGRCTMFKTPAHTAAMLLDPEFRDATLCDDAEVQQALVEAQWLRHGGRRDDSIASRVRRHRVHIAIDTGARDMLQDLIVVSEDEMTRVVTEGSTSSAATQYCILQSPALPPFFMSVYRGRWSRGWRREWQGTVVADRTSQRNVVWKVYWRQRLEMFWRRGVMVRSCYRTACHQSIHQTRARNESHIEAQRRL